MDNDIIAEHSDSASAFTDSDVVKERLWDLESDLEDGWWDEDRHDFLLVRVPNTFLEVLRYQVRCHTK
jgi:hypothetical protein